MNANSNGRVIRIAAAGSLAVHLIFATLVHPPRVEAQAQEKLSPAVIIHLIPPKRTPPRIVRRKTKAAPSQAHHVVVHPPHASTHADNSKRVAYAVSTGAPGTPGPSDFGTPGPGPIAGPTSEPDVPTPTPKPACSAPDMPARTTFVEQPTVPDTVAQTTATAKIRVDLDGDGNVRNVSVYESTGSMELDRAALSAARQSRYAPEQIDCKNVPGSYLFTVDFD
jgi:TonB family protein